IAKTDAPQLRASRGIVRHDPLSAGNNRLLAAAGLNDKRRAEGAAMDRVGIIDPWPRRLPNRFAGLHVEANDELFIGAVAWQNDEIAADRGRTSRAGDLVVCEPLFP